VDDPYEAPVNPEITLNTVDFNPEENAHKIMAYLTARGFVTTDGSNGGESAAEAEAAAASQPAG
jgi:hypothetical protein